MIWLMFGERGDGFAGLGHRVWSELQFGVLIDGVDHFARRQDAAEAIGDLLSGLRRHRHADEIGIAADGQVVGHHFDRGGDFAFAAAVFESTADFDCFELAEKIGKVAAGDFAKDRGFAVFERELRDFFDELCAADGVGWPVRQIRLRAIWAAVVVTLPPPVSVCSTGVGSGCTNFV